MEGSNGRIGDVLTGERLSKLFRKHVSIMTISFALESLCRVMFAL